MLLDGVKLPGANAPAVAAAAPNVTYRDLFFRFILLGWIAFGGPTAHIALFQKVRGPHNMAFAASAHLGLIVLRYRKDVSSTLLKH